MGCWNGDFEGLIWPKRFVSWFGNSLWHFAETIRICTKHMWYGSRDQFISFFFKMNTQGGFITDKKYLVSVQSIWHLKKDLGVKQFLRNILVLIYEEYISYAQIVLVIQNTTGSNQIDIADRFVVLIENSPYHLSQCIEFGKHLTRSTASVEISFNVS